MNSNINNYDCEKKINKSKRKLFEDKYLINKEDPKLIEFLQILIEVSVCIIVDFYMNKKFILSGGYLENMKDYKTEILNDLIDKIFEKNSAKNSYFYIAFEELNKKFQNNKLVILIIYAFLYFIFCNYKGIYLIFKYFSVY